MVPDSWLGRGIEVHEAPTAHGRLSFAVRWHGNRPALLWELTPHEGVGPVRLTAPGLDPSWSAAEPNGEALLGPVEASA